MKKSSFRSFPGAAVSWGAFLILLLPPLALAEGPPDKADPADSCSTRKCHAEMKDLSYLHWPKFLSPGECAECHEQEGSEHTFPLPDGSARCLECHESLRVRLAVADSLHEGIDGGCLACHNPHGGEAKRLLTGVREGDERPLCFRCHDEDLGKREVVHDPVAEGKCSACHDPHTSKEGRLLRAKEGAALCGRCHEDIIEGIESASSVHDPVEDGCTDCHDPHGGHYPGMVLGKNSRLCEDCHDEVVELAEESVVDHGAMLSKRECLNCHAPHSSQHAPILKKAERDVCLECHDERLKSGEGELLDMKRWLRRNRIWHEPIREEGCSKCHQPHGGGTRRLLAKPYTGEIYEAFSIEHYALCFSCHEETMVTARRTREATRFRDGSRNLHFLHVNRAQRGRTCNACHEIHASSAPLQIRKYIPYGSWWMPLRFEKSETGGSCSSGCHRTRSYDRNRKDGPE